jgi:predicted nuclease of predicted toxin-antitoxin system
VKFLFDHDVPDDMAYALDALGHEVFRLRQVLPVVASDEEVLRFAGARELVLITCNRDDFLNAAQHISHAGLIILIRRRSRALERAALVRLLDRAGETGIKGNINFT